MISKRFSAAAFASIICGTAIAQQKVEIKFSTEAEREVWVLQEKPDEMPVGGKKYSSKEFSISIPEGGSVVVIHDESTGNVAMRQLKEIKGPWNVKTGDWRIGRVEVEAFSRGEPLPKGRITAAAANYKSEREVQNGKAIFFAIPPGEVQFTASYTSGGADKRSNPLRVTLSRFRDERVPAVQLTVSDKVDASPQGTQENVEESKSSPIVNVVIWLVALAVGIGAILFILQMLRKNEAAVATKLRQLGVQVPSDVQDDDAQPASRASPFEDKLPLVPEGHCQYCGQAFDENGHCACAVPPRGAAMAPVSISNPRLAGDAFSLDIPEGVSVIGRESELAIQDPTVSRRHAEVRREQGKVTLKDMGSANGTFVNGAKIDSETELSAGDTVQFGAVRMRFEG